MALLIGKATLGQNESAGLIFQPLSFFHHRQKTSWFYSCSSSFSQLSQLNWWCGIRWHPQVLLLTSGAQSLCIMHFQSFCICI